VQVRTIQDQFIVWKNLCAHGKERVEEAKDVEGKIIKDIEELQRLVRELESKVGDVPSEVESRSTFIADTKFKLTGWYNAINTTQYTRKMEDKSETVQGPDSTSIDDETVYRKPFQVMKERQDEAMVAIKLFTTKLKNLAGDIGSSIDQDNELLDRANLKAEEERQRLRGEQSFLNGLLKASGEKKSWIAIAILGLLFVILVVVAFSVN